MAVALPRVAPLVFQNILRLHLIASTTYFHVISVETYGFTTAEPPALTFAAGISLNSPAVIISLC